jgi:two-component system, chemotaxis family, CheB/CheR fusion protein
MEPNFETGVTLAADTVRSRTGGGTFVSTDMPQTRSNIIALNIQPEPTEPSDPPHMRTLGALAEGIGQAYLHEVLQALPTAIYTTDPFGRITFFNEAAAALWGCRPKLGTDEWCGSWRLYWPDGTSLPHNECPMAMAVKQRRPIKGMEAAAERPDGTRVPFMAFPSPLYDSTGKFVGAVNMLVDISHRKQAEQDALFLAAIVESSSDAIVSKDLTSTIRSWNRSAERLFGYSAQEAIGRSILMLIPPDRQHEEVTILARIRAGELIDHYETVRRRKDGSHVEVSLTISPIKNAAGEVIGASNIARDITERKHSERQIATLAREAEHRAKNILASVQATVHLSHAETAAGLKEVIDGRIQALANVHSLFVESRWVGAELRRLVSQELSAYCQQDGARASIEGPDVSLETETAQAIAVCIHELTTNAAKYGALSRPEGRVRVQWQRTPDGGLSLRWSETGGPPVSAPTRQGFGTRMINALIGKQLRGTTHFAWDAEGARCELTIPPRPGSNGGL